MPAVPISFIDGSMFDDEQYENDTPVRKDLPPGSASWCNAYSTNEIACLLFTCPCGCGSIGSLEVRPTGDRPRWNWDGNKEKPTTTPSVLKTSGCKWHGYLTAGVWKPC